MTGADGLEGGRPRLLPLMARELRGARGRMAFFVVCLAVGVAAVVAVAGISAGLEEGVRREARRLLAADLVVEGPEPVPEELAGVLEGLGGARRADVRELVTMVSVVEGVEDVEDGPAGGRERGAAPPGRRERTGVERQARASARAAPDRDRALDDDESASRDALRPRTPAPDRPPTGSADGRGQVERLAGAHRSRGLDEAERRGAPAGGSPRRTSQLVELKVVSGGYPFYGEMEVVPDRPLPELLADGGAVAAPELMEALELEPGDRLRVGTSTATIRGVVRSEPDRLGGAFGFSAGPRLFVGPELFGESGLETTGSRIRYRALLALPPGAPPEAAAEWAERIAEGLPGTGPGGAFDVETWTEAQPALRQGIARAERFLGLVALLSLLVGGIGVGQTVRAWLAGRLDAVAVLKCIGLRPREIALVYAGQVILLGVAGSLLGAAAGVAVELAVPRVAAGVLPPGLLDSMSAATRVGPVLRGVALGTGVALLFGLPSLSSVLRVPPVRVLRRAVDPLPVPRAVAAATGAALLAGVWAAASVQAGSAVLGARFTAGATAAAAVLALAAWGVSRAAAALPRQRAAFGGRFWLRHGLAALARPGASTLAATVALGLGVLVLVGLWLVERRLTDELTGNLPEEAPSVFLVDVQPDQWPGVRRILLEEGASSVDSVPVVMARLAAVDAVRVERLAVPDAGEEDSAGSWDDEEGERQWALTREQRLTYLDELPEDNRIVSGALWSDPDLPEVSVEQDFARDLGVEVGSTLTFDVQGVDIELAVTSVRTVDWSTFGINFFLVVEPGVLDRAPQHRVAAAQLPPEAEGRAQDRIAAAYPNVTVLRVREILEKVVATLSRLASGIRFVGAFTVLAGVAILAGAVSAGALRRRREVALLKTLGTTRAGVVAAYAVEYALVGLVAGTVGCAGGAVLARTILVRGMEVEWVLEPLPLLGALAASAALTVVAGLAASFRALQSRPVDVLRSP